MYSGFLSVFVCVREKEMAHSLYVLLVTICTHKKNQMELTLKCLGKKRQNHHPPPPDLHHFQTANKFLFCFVVDNKNTHMCTCLLDKNISQWLIMELTFLDHN